MKEIKFRAWDTIRKKMFIPNWILTIQGSAPNNKMEEPEYGEMHHNKDAILMQYTSMEDINGIEIYEGDIIRSGTVQGIVKFGEYKTYYSDCGSSGDMIDKETQIGFYLLKKDGIMRWDTIAIWHIIGNIYENPELIK